MNDENRKRQADRVPAGPTLACGVPQEARYRKIVEDDMGVTAEGARPGHFSALRKRDSNYMDAVLFSIAPGLPFETLVHGVCLPQAVWAANVGALVDPATHKTVGFLVAFPPEELLEKAGDDRGPAGRLSACGVPSSPPGSNLAELMQLRMRCICLDDQLKSATAENEALKKALSDRQDKE